MTIHPEETKFKRSVKKQFLLGMLTNFSSIAPSMSIGFSAVAIPALSHLTTDQTSWFASIASLATPFGSFFSGPIADRFGRRTAIFCVNVICFIGWLTIAGAYYMEDGQYTVLLIGRLLTGFSTGLSSVPASIYMAEISSSKLRAVFTTWSSMTFALGVLIVYVLGYIFKEYWGTISLISAVFPCFGILFNVFFIPESPSWLVSKNRIEEAKTNMCKIFGTEQYIPEVENEITNLIKSKPVKTSNEKKSILVQFINKVKYLTKPVCLRPFILILTFFFFQQFSGVFSIVFYAIDIVKEAGITIDAYLAIVLIGVVRLVSAIFLSYIIKHFGRRALGITSGVGMGICMLTLGGYILLIEQRKITEVYQDKLSFLPIILLLLYFFTSTIGFLPLPFALAAECFPTKIRGTASGLLSGMGYLFNFVTVKTYLNMRDGMGSKGIFFFYGAMSFAGAIFVISLLPETKGKSLQEIEECFESKKQKQERLMRINSC